MKVILELAELQNLLTRLESLEQKTQSYDRQIDGLQSEMLHINRQQLQQRSDIDEVKDTLNDQSETIANLSHAVYIELETARERLEETHSAAVMDSGTGEIIPYGDQRSLWD